MINKGEYEEQTKHLVQLLQQVPEENLEQAAAAVNKYAEAVDKWGMQVIGFGSGATIGAMETIANMVTSGTMFYASELIPWVARYTWNVAMLGIIGSMLGYGFESLYINARHRLTSKKGE